ncbi:vWA domain-containing protein [uncultured Tateyamaria sp.]|uniref:vWA domain-containing protein n=1 Tax=Tateyamaria sp. TaxID=1929288 RepID=UPI00260751B4|nr:vWA domain-containing protein [uncultured Tateyamaria sp.]
MTFALTRPLIALTTMLIICATALVAQQRRPLLLENTSSIYERVLTRPGAVQHSAPDGAATGTYPAFQPLYVFARQNDWIEVGPSPNAPPEGWVKEPGTVQWKQNIVGAFTNSAGRSRQLLFDTQGNLEWLMNHEAVRDVQERMVAEASAGVIGGERGTVSVEPAEFVNIRDDLYLMPILEFTEGLHPLTYDEILMMQVASVPKQAAQAQTLDSDETDPFDVGIVLVLDTTQSMENYIALTQRVLQGTVRQIQNTEIGELVNFGAIGFRDNVDAAPGLEYRTKTLIGLERRQDQTPVITALGNAVNVADVNSPGFNEDSLAGVEDAIDTIDWDQLQGDGDKIDARYVILVTDAGPKDPRDPNARSEIGAVELQQDAEGRNIVVMTLHLKTPNGAGNHAYAAGKYRQLSRFAGREFYFPIEGGSEPAFEGVVTRLVTALTDHVRTARGEATLLNPEEAGDDLVELGRAMQLAWLGSQRGTQAPDVIKGWLSNKAVEDPSRLAIEPRLLVTKNEMASMAEFLDNLVRIGETAQSSQQSLDFFGQVRGLIADMAQNPDLLINANADTLGGAMEFLDRLPYQSQILDMSEQRWAESAMMRRSLIDGMRQKLTQYRKWLFDSSVWTELYEGSPDGEYVFAMPFDVLP